VDPKLSGRAISRIVAEAEHRLANMKEELARLKATPESTETERRALQAAIDELKALIDRIKRTKKKN
jgi:septal ring factor EnvC (AmiA/AmiB activator)